MCFVCFIACQLIAFVVNVPFVLANLITWDDAISGPFGAVAGILLMMGVYKWWFRPEFEGMLKGNLPLGFLLGMIELIYVLITVAASYFTGALNGIKPLTMMIVGTSLMGGMGEEFAFRGVLSATMLRQWKDQNKFRTIALISGIVFGLVHAGNLISGANPFNTLLKVADSIGIVVFFAAVYMRPGTILPCMFYHTVHDIIPIAVSSQVSEKGLITGGATDWSDGLNLVLSIVLMNLGHKGLREEYREDRRYILFSNLPGVLVGDHFTQVSCAKCPEYRDNGPRRVP